MYYLNSNGLRTWNCGHPSTSVGDRLLSVIRELTSVCITMFYSSKHLFFRSARIRLIVINNYKIHGFTLYILFWVPRLIVQFSKCDFWNLGDFLNRNMWSKKNSSKNLWPKKKSIEKIVSEKYFFETKKFSYEKSQWKIKFLKFRFFQTFRRKIEISNFHFSLTFS